MRALALAGLTVLLCSCNQEPSFDERYATTEKEISERAADIDQDLTPSKQDTKSPGPNAAGADTQRPPS